MRVRVAAMNARSQETLRAGAGAAPGNKACGDRGECVGCGGCVDLWDACVFACACTRVCARAAEGEGERGSVCARVCARGGEGATHRWPSSVWNMPSGHGLQSPISTLLGAQSLALQGARPFFLSASPMHTHSPFASFSFNSSSRPSPRKVEVVSLPS